MITILATSYKIGGRSSDKSQVVSLYQSDHLTLVLDWLQRIPNLFFFGPNLVILTLFWCQNPTTKYSLIIIISTKYSVLSTRYQCSSFFSFSFFFQINNLANPLSPHPQVQPKQLNLLHQNNPKSFNFFSFQKNSFFFFGGKGWVGKGSEKKPMITTTHLKLNYGPLWLFKIE